MYNKINLLNFYMLTWPLRLFFHNFIPERCTRLFVFLFYKIQYYFKFKEYINAYKVIFRFVSMFFKLINHGLDYIEILKKKKLIQDSNLRYMIHWWKKKPLLPILIKILNITLNNFFLSIQILINFLKIFMQYFIFNHLKKKYLIYGWV